MEAIAALFDLEDSVEMFPEVIGLHAQARMCGLLMATFLLLGTTPLRGLWTPGVVLDDVAKAAITHLCDRGCTHAAYEFAEDVEHMVSLGIMKIERTDEGEQIAVKLRETGVQHDTDALMQLCHDGIESILASETGEPSAARRVEVEGEAFASFPDPQWTRGLVRVDRRAKAARRSPSGKRAVGDLGILLNEGDGSDGGPQVSGHAEEFCGWCAASAGATHARTRLKTCQA